MKAFNSKRLLQMAGDDIDQAREHFKIILNNSHRQLGEVKIAIKERDCVATANAVCSLKGMLSQAGADRAAGA